MDTIKTFAKAQLINTGLTSSIPFTDTSGNAISCNYISVVTSSTTTDTGSYLVIPQGIYESSSISLLTDASGTGGALGRAEERVTIILAGNDLVTGVHISNFLSANTGFYVEYGVLAIEGNSLRGSLALPKGA